MTPGEIAAFKAGQLAMQTRARQSAATIEDPYRETSAGSSHAWTQGIVDYHRAIRALPIEEPSDDAPTKGGSDGAD